MSRLIKNDFDQIIAFLKDYSVTESLKDPDFSAFISTLHKKYYSYLVCMEELRLFVDDNQYETVLTSKQFYYLQESVSDCGQCFFLALNGCYKGAKLLLRSSIETFIRALCIDEDSTIETETSVYEVFNKIKQIKIFVEKPSLEDNIHDEYKNLCGDVHTAGVQRMSGVTALKFFPHFDKNEANVLSRSILRLLPCYVTLLCLKFNKQFHQIHYENKDVISKEILRDYKAAVYGIEE